MIHEVNTYVCSYLLMQIIRQLSKEIDLFNFFNLMQKHLLMYTECDRLDKQI